MRATMEIFATTAAKETRLSMLIQLTPSKCHFSQTSHLCLWRCLWAHHKSSVRGQTVIMKPGENATSTGAARHAGVVAALFVSITRVAPAVEIRTLVWWLTECASTARIQSLRALKRSFGSSAFFWLSLWRCALSCQFWLHEWLKVSNENLQNSIQT